jgi:hypothetical protein
MAAQDTEDGKTPEAAAPSALTTFGEHRSLLFSIAYRMLGTAVVLRCPFLSAASSAQTLLHRGDCRVRGTPNRRSQTGSGSSS